MTPNKDLSSTFFKGLQVLSAFDDNHPRLTLAEAGKITELDRAAVRRLMITLVEFGYVEKLGKHFTLSPKVLTLSGSYMRGNGIGAVVQPILNRYSKEVGLEISLAGVADSEAVYIAKSILADTDISFGFTIGSRLPLLQSAIGRMLLATSKKVDLEHVLQTAALRAFTPDSLLDRDLIRHQVESARAQGFAVVSNEFEAGVAGLAVAVGPMGDAETVIGLSFPVADLKKPKFQSHALSVLQHCANELSRTQIGV